MKNFNKSLLLSAFFSLVLLIQAEAQLVRGLNQISRNTVLGTAVSRIVPVDTGHFWTGASAGGNILAYYDSGNWTSFLATDFGLPALNVRDITGSNGKLWMGTSIGLLQFSINGAVASLDSNYATSNGFFSNDIRSVDENDGRLAIGTSDGLAVRFQNNWTFYNNTNGNFPANRVYKVRINGNQLAAVTDSGISYKNGNQQWVHYNLSFLQETAVGALQAAPFGDGGVMVVSANQVFYIIGNNRYELSEDAYYSSAKGSRDLLVTNGNIWSLSTNGVMSLTGKKDIFSASAPMGNNVRLVTDNQGYLYTVGSINILIYDSTNFYSNRNNGVNSAILDIGNYRMYFNAKSDFFFDATTNNYLAEFPKRTNMAEPQKKVGFAANIWIGGRADNNVLHASAQTYRQTSTLGHNFWSGPLLANGQVDVNNQRSFDRVWKINRFDIEELKRRFQNNTLNDPSFSIPADILEWPAFRPGTQEALAPFFDRNQDGQYNPLDGDYPEIKGDQMLWYVYNDLNPERIITQAPLGVEVITSIYGFTCPTINSDSSVLNATIFINKKINNRSSRNYTQTSVGMWQDNDLGYGMDDFVGSHIPLNMVYTYNGDDDDEGINGYGNRMPAVGTMVLRGPKAPTADGIDNNRNGVIDEANEDIGLTSHTYFNNDGSVIGNPSTGRDAYFYLTGRWKDSTGIVYGGNGYPQSNGSTNLATRIMFPGNSDAAVGWGLGGTTANPVTPPFAWSENNPGPGASPNLVSDRRNVLGMSGFSLNAGATEEITLAYVISQSTQTGALASVNQLIADAPKVKHWFATNRFPSCLDLTTLSLDEQKLENSLTVYPNPSNDWITVVMDENAQGTITLYNMQGQVLEQQILEAGRVKLNLSAYPAGMYLVRWSGAGAHGYSKVIKP